jgi:UV DNA damage repair endonuclease
MYLSFHASEFVVLNSKTKTTVENSVTNLNFFGKILSLMKLKNTPNLVIHIGGYKSFINWE